LNDSPARLEPRLILLLCLVFLTGSSWLRADFRIEPYLQNPTPQAITMVWFSENNQPGQLILQGDGVSFQKSLVSSPLRADALAYHPEELVDDDSPYHHEIRIDGLEPGKQYQYRVRQGEEEAEGRFSTPSLVQAPLRFVVFGDSETEPESAGKATPWPGAGGLERHYLVDQETGYRENLKIIEGREPHFVAIAGDLVQSGGEQRDWDAFWRLTGPLASQTYLFPALGNHEYFAGPGVLGGYGAADSGRAVEKYQTYFDLPAAGSGTEGKHEHYYRVDWGPVTLIALDLNNGLPNRAPGDTNFYMLGAGEGGFAPDWQPGSAQYRWLEQTLEQAQRDSAFTFVVFHHCPYSSGVHGQSPGRGEGQDPLSGKPLQKLTPLFMRYGVDALFTGHDEMYEHSIVPGKEQMLNGGVSEHQLHVYDVGIGGDGLRGPIPGLVNPHRVFLAHDDAPEIYDERGVLLDGGKHYGHLEVNVNPAREGGWQARLDMVYVFPVTNSEGKVLGFERRLYDDSITLFSNRRMDEE